MTGWAAPLWLPALCLLALVVMFVLALRDVVRARRARHER